MKIDFSQKFTIPGGKELDLHLGQITLQALNSLPQQQAGPLPLNEAVKRGNLAIQVAEGGEHDITPEDAAMIRKNLPNVRSPVVVALAAKALEG